MMHDMLITENYSVFMDSPIVFDMDGLANVVYAPFVVVRGQHPGPVVGISAACGPGRDRGGRHVGQHTT